VKVAVHKQVVNGSGIRAISRCLGISTDNVIAEFKKEADISNVNKEYFQCRSHSKIRVGMDKLLELLSPLDIGNVYTDGNDAYYKRIDSDVLIVTKKNTQKIERKHLSLRTWCSRLVRKGIRFSKMEQMHKIVVGLIINVWFFGCHWLIQ
jgi:insertion element IS1 protein InsB